MIHIITEVEAPLVHRVVQQFICEEFIAGLSFGGNAEHRALSEVPSMIRRLQVQAEQSSPSTADAWTFGLWSDLPNTYAWSSSELEFVLKDVSLKFGSKSHEIKIVSIFIHVTNIYSFITVKSQGIQSK